MTCISHELKLTVDGRRRVTLAESTILPQLPAYYIKSKLMWPPQPPGEAHEDEAGEPTSPAGRSASLGVSRPGAVLLVILSIAY